MTTEIEILRLMFYFNGTPGPTVFFSLLLEKNKF